MSEKIRNHKSGNFVICDIQTEYAECLFKVLTEAFSGEYQFYLFHDAEKMSDFVGQSGAEILLIGEEYDRSVYRSLCIKKVFILTGMRDKKPSDEEIFLFRYQSADRITGDIRAAAGRAFKRDDVDRDYLSERRVADGTAAAGYLSDATGTDGGVRRIAEDARCPPGSGAGRIAEEARCPPESGAGKIAQGDGCPPEAGVRKITEYERYHPGKPGISGEKAAVFEDAEHRGLIGVYSPIHRIGKTRFALRLGEKLAQNVPVLYLNLEGYAGGGYYFGDGDSKDLGDLMYCLRQERSDHGLKISSMTGQKRGMDYVMPMRNELDLRAVKAEEWLRFLDLISEKCVYEAIVLDLGDCVDGLYDILGKCSRVYTPYVRDGISLAKLEQYEENLRVTGNEHILRRMVKKLMQRKKRPERTDRPDDQDRTAL